MESSRLLGILSIVYSLVPLIGVVTACCGLSQLREKDENRTYNQNLNIIGLVISIAFWIYNVQAGVV